MEPMGLNRELQMLYDLRHPNCISVTNSYSSEEVIDGERKKYLHIVMDFIPNNLYSILREYKKANQNFPEILAMIYSYQLYRCLHYLQAVHIMHRDIKPQNILVDTKRHQVLFCDFGSAKKLTSNEPNISYICSRFYRAPELLLGNEVYGSAVDLWSVGCVIAEIFLGQPFFWGSNSEDQLAKIAEVIGSPDDFDLKAMGNRRPVNIQAVKPLTVKKKLMGKASDLAIDLISKTLVYNPEKRIKPLDAMMHPFFDRLRQEKLAINGHEITDLFNFLPEEIEGNTMLINKLTPRWYHEKISKKP